MNPYSKRWLNPSPSDAARYAQPLSAVQNPRGISYTHHMLSRKSLLFLAAAALLIAALGAYLWQDYAKLRAARKTLMALANMEQVFYERSMGYTESLRELSLVLPRSDLAIEAAKDCFLPGSLVIEISEDKKSVALAAQAKDRKKTWVSYTASQKGETK